MNFFKNNSEPESNSSSLLRACFIVIGFVLIIWFASHMIGVTPITYKPD